MKTLIILLVLAAAILFIAFAICNSNKKEQPEQPKRKITENEQ